MSNAEKLVDVQTNGLCCLCFPNKYGLSIDEIQEIFSVYGQIASINCAGGDNGFRFVRFQNKEDAVRCAIALENDARLKLQPVRRRYNDENTSSAQSNGSKRQWNKQVQDAQGISKTYTNNRENPTIEHQRSNTNNHHGNNISNDNASRATTNGYQGQSTNFRNDHSENISVNSDPKIQNQRSNQDFQINDNNHNNENHHVGENLKKDKLEALYKLRGMNANTFAIASGDTGMPSNQTIGNVSKNLIDPPRTNENACRYVNQVPQTEPDALPNTNVISDVDSSSNSSRCSNRSRKLIADAPPMLIEVPYDSTQAEYSTKPSPEDAYSPVPDENVQVIIAQCVVVANIHLNLGLSDIHRLFQKFDPIHISDIKVVPEINVRYCSVYFKTAAIATEAEKKYDRLSVCGENLIVLRPRRLQEEASIC